MSIPIAMSGSEIKTVHRISRKIMEAASVPQKDAVPNNTMVRAAPSSRIAIMNYFLQSAK